LNGSKLADSSAVPQADRRIICPDVATQRELHRLGSYVRGFFRRRASSGTKKSLLLRYGSYTGRSNSRRFAKVFSSERLELSPEAPAMKRRLTPSLTPIRMVTFVVALVCALALMGPQLSRPVSAQSKATATNVPVIPHEAVPNFFKNPPGIYTGENMGISTNSKGQIYIYHRAYETRL